MEYLQYDTETDICLTDDEVLNLVISGIPSILKLLNVSNHKFTVLNLVISGIPSILIVNDGTYKMSTMF